VLNRLKTVAGHVRGVQRMVEADAYCIDIIKQTQAVQRALDRIGSLLLEAHLNGAVVEVLRDEHLPEREHVINELLTVFRQAHGDAPDLPAPALATERIPQRMDWLEHLEARVRGIQDLLKDEAYPVAVITEIKAVQGMLDAFQSRVLADHLNGCVTTAIRSQRPAERERVVEELLHVFNATSKL
jgi:DNA-binding FrmR family transcriptional regulator